MDWVELTRSIHTNKAVNIYSLIASLKSLYEQSCVLEKVCNSCLNIDLNMTPSFFSLAVSYFLFFLSPSYCNGLINIYSIPIMAGTPYPDILDIEISVVRVAHQLETLNPHKSGGPDEIPPRFLKELANYLAPSLSLIFQTSLRQGIVPDDWKRALVVPVFNLRRMTGPTFQL